MIRAHGSHPPRDCARAPQRMEVTLKPMNGSDSQGKENAKSSNTLGTDSLGTMGGGNGVDGVKKGEAQGGNANCDDDFDGWELGIGNSDVPLPPKPLPP